MFLLWQKGLSLASYGPKQQCCPSPAKLAGQKCPRVGFSFDRLFTRLWPVSSSSLLGNLGVLYTLVVLLLAGGDVYLGGFVVQSEFRHVPRHFGTPVEGQGGPGPGCKCSRRVSRTRFA